MGKKKDVIMRKLGHNRNKLLRKIRSLKDKINLKNVSGGIIGLVVVIKMIILIIWEIETIVN